MKKLLLILLCLPMIFGCGNNESDKEGVVNEIAINTMGCKFEGSLVDISKLCNFYTSNNFSADKNADLALEKILSVTGLAPNFTLKACNEINNCIATSYKGIRYILYDKEFMSIIVNRTNDWSNLAILAHEIGHHVNGHSLDLVIYANEVVDAPTLRESRQMELEADEYAGFVMYKLGASLSQAQEAFSLVSKYGDDTYETHPSKTKRLKAVAKGFHKAKLLEIKDDVGATSNLQIRQMLYEESEHLKVGDWDAWGKRDYWLAIADENVYKKTDKTTLSLSNIKEDFQTAIPFYEKAYDAWDDPVSRSTICERLAWCYERIGDYETACKYYKLQCEFLTGEDRRVCNSELKLYLICKSASQMPYKNIDGTPNMDWMKKHGFTKTANQGWRNANDETPASYFNKHEVIDN